MPVVSFDYSDYIKLLGYNIPKKELIEKLPMIGANLDRVEENTICIEFFPNRPDLSSVEGVARASRAFFGFEKGIKQYPISSSDIVINVDPSVKEVRPYVMTGLVRNLIMTDELIASLMDMQEKLHAGLGRNRRKVAIGVHNYEPIQPPFTYKAVNPDSVEFIPLAKFDTMTLREILVKHEKGIDYAHLLNGFDKYPLIVDKNNNVLSFPPIINGSLTEVTPFTTDLFIDVTGWEKKAINYALNIITTALIERGGELFSTIVNDNNKKEISPNLTPTRRELSISYLNSLLGTSLSQDEIMNCLMKLEYNVTTKNEKTLSVEIPPWRADILHEIDLVEDVAVGYGYEKFSIEFPNALTFGQSIPKKQHFDNLRIIMIGLGFNEVTTFTISNELEQFTRVGNQIKKRVEIANPIGEEYSCIRVNLIPSLLKILAENRHHPLPQKIFELGIVVGDNYKNSYHLAALKIDAKAHFTECKSIVETLIRNAGNQCTIVESEHPGFIKGRIGSIRINTDDIGVFGELHPRTIQNFELEHPIIAIELNADHFIKV